MVPSGRTPVARALLFDRLVDLEPKVPAEARPLRTLDADALRASVAREIHMLLNTRCSPRRRGVHGSGRSTVDYGIPDFSPYSDDDFDGWKHIAESVREAIAAFEPRLRNVKVKILGRGERLSSLALRIDATLHTEWLREPVSFPISLDPVSGGSDVRAGG